jgi:hypothetical protein
VGEFASLERRVGLLAGEFDGTNGRKRLQVVAKQTAKDVDEAVRADLGDQSMSGWRRGGPIKVTGAAKVISDTEISVFAAGKGKGPMRVLEQGRNQGNAGGFSGPGINTRTGVTARTKSGGVRKVRARKGKRWNGTTDGKGTWSDAVQLMQGRVGKRVDDQVVDAIRSHIGKG